MFDTLFVFICWSLQCIICFLMIFYLFSGEQGMVDEAQKALEEAEALKKVFV